MNDEMDEDAIMEYDEHIQEVAAELAEERMLDVEW